MAKPSKTHQFGNYEDEDQLSAQVGLERIPEPEITHSLREPRATISRTDGACSRGVRAGNERTGDRGSHEGVEEDVDITLQHNADCGLHDADDERRESAFTSASVSSLPESAFETDYERGVMRKPYTPPMIRPSFRRPESVRRMQMSSPAPSERSLRRSVFSPPRARTPRSTRSSVKSSPRRQKSAEEEPRADKYDYPLVLLHLTLLPIDLRWSKQSMEQLLPPDTIEGLQLLRSKVSSTILQRGILIPHPQDEYGLLEERLLEALELKKETVTRCGHVRARDSTSSASSADSGVGSSVEGFDDGISCETCHFPEKTVRGTVSSRARKWSIKIFAANGLMRASAWTAAWAEMESVDVEILPWIDDELRKSLDARALEEAAEEHAKQEEEARRMTEAEERYRTGEDRAWVERAASRRKNEPQDAIIVGEHTRPASSATAPDGNASKPSNICNDLPQVYRPKDIPLSLLLRNYIFLLAQDKRNVVIFGLALLALFVSLRAALGPHTNLALPAMCEDTHVKISALQHLPNDSSDDQSSTSNNVGTSSEMRQIEAVLQTETMAAEEVFASSLSDGPAAAREDVVHDTIAAGVGDSSLDLLQKGDVAEHNPLIVNDSYSSQEQCPNSAFVTGYVSLFRSRERLEQSLTRSSMIDNRRSDHEAYIA